MGTRNITAVYMDGEYRVAQYGQWDGYPSGQGETIRAFFARPDFDMQKFREQTANCVFLNEDQIALADEKIKTKGGMEEAGLGHLSRDCGAEILDFVYDSKQPLGVVDQLSFVAESLFCEWAYVIDLDKGVLEVYRGFNTTPLTETDRFFFLQNYSEDWRPSYEGQEQYMPVKLTATIPLDELAQFDMGSLEEKEEEA